MKNDLGPSIGILIALSVVNVIILIGAGFAGQVDVVIFGQGIPVKTLILISILNALANFRASLNTNVMIFIGGLIPAIFTILAIFNSIYTETEKEYLVGWLIFSGVIYFSGVIGGVIAYIYKKNRTIKI